MSEQLRRFETFNKREALRYPPHKKGVSQSVRFPVPGTALAVLRCAVLPTQRAATPPTNGASPTGAADAGAKIL